MSERPYGWFPNRTSYRAALGAVYVTFAATLLYHGLHALPWFQPVMSAEPCSASSGTVELRIVAGAFTPPGVTAARCQRLRITNDDAASYWLAFGDHERHLRYPGFSERILRTGNSQEFTLSVDGRFRLHNHFDERMTVTVDVAEN